MDLTSIIVALITGGVALIGTIITNKKSTALLEYRLDQLEKKVDIHNGYAEKFASTTKDISVITEQIKVINHRLEDGERAIDTIRKMP